jgi:type IV pilus assembly protein PilQ
VLPDAEVYVDGREIVVDWSETKEGVTDKKVGTVTETGTTIVSSQKSYSPQPGAPAVATEFKFNLVGAQSVFNADFGGDTSQLELIQPRTSGNIIRFGVANAAIPRSLRRVIDASVFPSSVLQITPYSTIIDATRNVMFAVQLKGEVEYSVALNGNTLDFRCANAEFADAAADDTQVAVSVPEAELNYNTSTAPQASDAYQASEDSIVGEVLESLSASEENLGVQMTDEPMKVYTGEPVSFTFDDADIRRVMLLLGEVEGKNIIISDDVTGKITLKLSNVPWDQALDLVLDIGGLSKEEAGNVIRIMTLKEKRNKEEEKLQTRNKLLEIQERNAELEGFDIKFITINYVPLEKVVNFVTGASENKNVEDHIQARRNSEKIVVQEEEAGTWITPVDNIGLMSKEGSIRAVDGTKQVMIMDMPHKIKQIENLIKKIDQPLRQVMIEARIVEADTSGGLDIGINWGFSYQNDEMGGLTSPTGGVGIENMDSVGIGLGGAFLLPSTIGTSGLGGEFTFGRLGFDDKVLDLRISALESAGKGRVVSSPKILTLDGEEAEITDGTEIPYKTTSQDGTTTEFEEASLSLTVTPEINPDDSLLLDIEATNSRPGPTYSDGTGIITKEAKTKLLVKNGITTVIGGVYVDSEITTQEGVPLIKDIPFLGRLFRSDRNSNERRELLIFITPRIVE